MKSLHFRGAIIPSAGNAAAVTTPVTCRIIIAYDRQCNGAAPATADLITAYTNNGATSNLTYDGINMNNRDRFIILMDDQIVLPQIGINGATPASTVLTFTSYNSTECQGPQGQLNINRFIKLKGLETHFKASSTPGVIGDIATGSLLLFTISNDAGATPAYDLQSTFRLKFLD